MSPSSEDTSLVFPSPPPIPSARVLRPATLAVGHFHSVLARGAEWWGEKRIKAVERPAGVPLASLAAADEPDRGDVPSTGGRGLTGLGERAGRGSSVWAVARGTGNSLGELGDRKRDRSMSSSGKGKSGSGSFSSAGAGAGGGVGAGGGKGGLAASVVTSLDEYHACPRLKFQLLLREQGIIVTLFDAMEKVNHCLSGRKTEQYEKMHTWHTSDPD